MRVAHVIPGMAARQGGPSIVVVSHALALRDHGVETVIFTTDLCGPASARSAARVRPADFPRGAEQLDIRVFPTRRPTRFAYCPALGRALEREAKHFDVIHIHSLYLHPTYTASRVARKQGIPYVLSPHGALDPALRGRSRTIKRISDVLWQKRAINAAGAVHYTTPAEAALVADLDFRAPAVVVPNAVDSEGSSSAGREDDFRKRYLNDSRGPVVLILGRISHKKGIDVLISALPLLRRTFPEINLVVAGPDDEGLRSELQALGHERGVSDAITFTGMLREDERLAAFASASVFALPSKTENFGNVVVEAMAAGVPVVVSRHVNLAGSLIAADAGVVCERSPQEFAQAITQVLQVDGERARLVKRGHDFARSFSFDAVMPRLAAMYESCAAHAAFPATLDPDAPTLFRTPQAG